MDCYVFTIGTYNKSINLLEKAKDICHYKYLKNALFMVKETSSNNYYHVHIIYYYLHSFTNFSLLSTPEIKITKPQKIENIMSYIQYIFKSNPSIDDLFYYAPYREYQLVKKNKIYHFEPFFQPFILINILDLNIYHPAIEHILLENLNKILYMGKLLDHSCYECIENLYPNVDEKLNQLEIIFSSKSQLIPNTVIYNHTYDDGEKESFKYDYLYHHSTDPLWKTITHEETYLIEEPACF